MHSALQLMSAHEPLFVLSHHYSVVCAAFYPFPGAHGDLLLTGDIGGMATLWSLGTHLPLCSFHPTNAALEQLPAGSCDPYLPHPSAGGVLSVGFLCPDKEKENSPKLPSRALEDGTLASYRTAEASLSEVAATYEKPRNRRFQLRRRPPSDCSQGRRTRRVYCFTKCRHQRLYLWAVDLPEDSNSDLVVELPKLLHILPVSQYGFCKAATAHIGPSSLQTTIFALPHDEQDGLSLWRVSPVLGEATESAQHRHFTDPEGEGLASSSLAERSQRSRGLVSTAAGVSELKVARLLSFGTNGGARTGAMMSVDLPPPVSSDSTSFRGVCGFVCVAFESGHVSLCKYKWHRGLSAQAPAEVTLLRAFPEAAMSAVWVGANSHTKTNVHSTGLLIATSAEGHLHVYRPAHPPAYQPPADATQNSDGIESDSVFTLQMSWQTKVPRGIGSVGVQQGLAVLGCWDGTVRLYHVAVCSDGEPSDVYGEFALCSILPFHTPHTVHTVAVAHPAVALSGPFSFDVRRPTRYNDEGEGVGVYAFCSAAKDGRVAVWRVDLHSMAKDGRLLSTPSDASGSCALGNVASARLTEDSLRSVPLAAPCSE